jgi:hypothetical protein
MNNVLGRDVLFIGHNVTLEDGTVQRTGFMSTKSTVLSSNINRLLLAQGQVDREVSFMRAPLHLLILGYCAF